MHPNRPVEVYLQHKRDRTAPLAVSHPGFPAGEQAALQLAAIETAKAIAANAPLSVRQAKKSITQGLQMDRASGMLFEIEAYYQLIPTEDRLEGINAYVQKRRPVFKGR